MPQNVSDAAREYRETDLLELRSALDDIRFLIADLQLYLALKAGFDPNQPRDAIGRWTDTGAGISPQIEPETRIAQSDGVRRYTVVLAEEEARGGHAIRRHVGKTDAELIARSRSMRLDSLFVTIAAEAQGSFASLEEANNFVNRVLEIHAPLVDQVSMGLKKEAWLQWRFGYQTGTEAYRPDPDTAPYMRPTYEVGVLIRHDKRSVRGYTVFTAFPLNQWQDRKKWLTIWNCNYIANNLYQTAHTLVDRLAISRDLVPEGEMKVPEEYYYLTQYFWNGSHEEVKTFDEWVANAVRVLNAEQRAVIQAFLEDVLRRNLPDEELDLLWRRSRAAYYFTNTESVRIMFRTILNQIAKYPKYKPKKKPSKNLKRK